MNGIGLKWNKWFVNAMRKLAPIRVTMRSKWQNGIHRAVCLMGYYALSSDETNGITFMPFQAIHIWSMQ